MNRPPTLACILLLLGCLIGSGDDAPPTQPANDELGPIKPLRTLDLQAISLSYAVNSCLDPVWTSITGIKVLRPGFEGPLDIKAGIYREDVFIFIRVPKASPALFHRPWTWNQQDKRFQPGSSIEDTVCLRWLMRSPDSSGSPTAFDLWHWGANRSSGGYADDMEQFMSSYPLQKSSEVLSPDAPRAYAITRGDTGTAPWRLNLSPALININSTRYLPAQPSGSRGDIMVHAVHTEGAWHLLFRRRATTAQPDDQSFLPSQSSYLDICSSLLAQPGPFHPDLNAARQHEPIRIHWPINLLE